MVEPLQIELFPVIVPAAFGNGFTVIAMVLAVPFPQPFEGVTDKLPELAPVKFTEIAVVPCPDVIVAPLGTVHV